MDKDYAQVGRYMNRDKSLYLNGDLVYLKDVEFTDGTIEVDFAAHGNRGFSGLIWRYEDENNYELLYLRPHKSGLYDALQYTPVFNGLTGWQFYIGEGYTAAAEIPINKWTHLKLVIKGSMANVYVNNSAEPDLIISELKRGKSKGSIGLWSALGSMSFANFEYTSNVENFVEPKEKPVKADPGVIMKWNLSNALPASSFSGEMLPSKKEFQKLKWKKVKTEDSGLLNIARSYERVMTELPDGTKTAKSVAYARVTIDSKKEQVRKLSFGYSDDVSIFLNGQIVFLGKNAWNSRNPFYLGILTLDNDNVYLNLKKGKNELVFAVTELFGGWDAIAKIENMDGIKIKN